ncbi:metal ABC transporter substrate-binding protein [Roseibacillus ishigakijimensis]|uniref:Zinc ABC transporter substrate-binding protein n=1 Tax=Roseibacillus ishigakijimensis TaxID=454146 RepID=A0A934RME6_9BACT|nr:metal ABC transporter substrate-binding protein [Roseibacillus ishigakijimensis]MBK1833498.1 zinc ABC transporter substrate-binding protein [Roseibacillus ishigakijimensis]
MKTTRIFPLLLALLALPTLRAEEKRPVLAPTNYPLKDFSTRLAGSFADILYQIPADHDPAFWKPTDEEVARIQQADLIIMNGATYEKWAVTTSLPYEGLVDTSLGFVDRYLETPGAIVHSHGNQGTHSHGGTAYITWLDFSLARQQALAIHDALLNTFPQKEKAVKAAFAQLEQDLQTLDQTTREALADFQGQALLASHPHYQYWSRAYGVEVHALLWEAGMTIDEKAVADFEALRAQHPAARIFLWDTAPSEANAAFIRKQGLINVVFSPCATPPAEGDFLSVMKDNLQRLQKALTE